jgi:hypothetical protein
VSEEEALPLDVEIEKPHVHQPSTGYNWLDMALPLAALFVSFISIYIAWHHGQVMKELVHQNEKLVEANSLPYLQLYGSSSPNGAAAFNVVNEGIGPARIATAQVLVDGRSVQNLDQLLQACCGSADRSGVSTSTLLGRMVRPGDSVTFIEFTAARSDPAGAAAFDRARQTGRIETRICYCSVFDDCWRATSKDPTPVAVNQCSAPKLAYRE